MDMDFNTAKDLLKRGCGQPGKSAVIDNQRALVGGLTEFEFHSNYRRAKFLNRSEIPERFGIKNSASISSSNITTLDRKESAEWEIRTPGEILHRFSRPAPWSRLS